jgi:rod shape-determining protein MreD
MIYKYFFLPFAALLLVVFQTSVLSILFMGRLSFEISLLLVIYAGFRMNILFGALLSFLLGFFLDCAIGSISGLYALIYVCIFFISAWVSLRVYSEQMSLIMIFAFLCSILEGLIIVLFYKIIYDISMFDNIFRIFLPQALVVSILSPLLFRLFHFFEVLFHGGDAKPAK